MLHLRRACKGESYRCVIQPGGCNRCRAASLPRADAEAQRASGGSAWPPSASSALDPQARLAGGRPSAGTGVQPESARGAWPRSAGSSRARQGGGSVLSLRPLCPSTWSAWWAAHPVTDLHGMIMLYFLCYAALKPPKRRACNSLYRRSAFQKATICPVRHAFGLDRKHWLSPRLCVSTMVSV